MFSYAHVYGPNTGPHSALVMVPTLTTFRLAVPPPDLTRLAIMVALVPFQGTVLASLLLEPESAERRWRRSSCLRRM
jgi:hypothetical protein